MAHFSLLGVGVTRRISAVRFNAASGTTGNSGIRFPAQQVGKCDVSKYHRPDGVQ